LPIELLETPAKLEIVTLPLSAPTIEPSVVRPESGWSASRSQPVTATAPARRPQSEAGIEIRPQTAAAVEVALEEPGSPAWAPTDPKRVCPTASEELLSVVRRLESPEIAVRKDALFELAELGATAQPVVAAVRIALCDVDSSVRAHAAWAVCRITGVNAECVDVLSQVLGSGDPAGATFAAYCLGLLEGEATVAVPALQTACSSDAAAVRLCAAEALLKITPEDAEPVAVLIEGLRSPEPEQRWLAAMSLSAAAGAYQESAVLALIPVLHDAEPDVSSSAALALGAYGSNARLAVPDLQTNLTHPDADVRDAATAALACIVE
jgi:HEAT repeat protein